LQIYQRCSIPLEYFFTLFGVPWQETLIGQVSEGMDLFGLKLKKKEKGNFFGLYCKKLVFSLLTKQKTKQEG